MEWLFGGASNDTKEAAKLDAKLSASTAQGRSAPTREDDSQHKKRGNEHFKRREYVEAVREYSLGIDAQPTATLFSNRSVRNASLSIYSVPAAYCALGRFDAALKDADAAIVLDPTWAKTYSRKGKAHYGQQSYRKAADAYARGLEICLKGAVGEAQQRDAELEALKKQTDSQTEAYLRLLGENNQLKRQIEDYQHMFGDWTKKQM